MLHDFYLAVSAQFDDLLRLYRQVSASFHHEVDVVHLHGRRGADENFAVDMHDLEARTDAMASEGRRMQCECATVTTAVMLL